RHYHALLTRLIGHRDKKWLFFFLLPYSATALTHSQTHTYTNTQIHMHVCTHTLTHTRHTTRSHQVSLSDPEHTVTRAKHSPKSPVNKPAVSDSWTRSELSQLIDPP